MKSWLKTGVEYLMTMPEANSRFIFLAQGLAGTIGLLVLTVSFVYDTGDRSLYPEMVWALGLVTGASAVGRFLTKKVGFTESGGALPPQQ